ncbi:MAG: glycosyltransferase family 2 protein [bacterium]|nr:glycosyltransferase family 2 protein [bacterium]
MKKIFVSIIIVNWNGKKWLKKCLDSLKSQTYKNFEIIMVDNASTDDSVAYVKKNYPEVSIYQSENKGFGHGCNLGAIKAKGEFLMFFNEDMYVDKNFLEIYVQEYEKIEKKELVGTIGCSIASYNKIIPECAKKMYGFGIDLMGAPMLNKKPDKIFHNTGCPLFISRLLFIKIGGFCENIFIYSEDIDICWRLNIYGYKHYFLKDTAIYHYGGGVMGDFSDKKLANYIKGEINALMNNYSWPFLILGIFYFLMFYLLMFAVYLTTGKQTYAKVIVSTIYREFRYNIKNILVFRKVVQLNRKISDRQLLGRIRIFPSRIRNLFE